MIHPNELAQKTWDYVIVGTGMGGGPIGLRLAQAGYSVLFLEKGRSPLEPDSIQGEFAELLIKDEKQETDILRRAGRLSAPLFDATKKRFRRLRPFLGQGVGGSSALYGMVLERFQAIDFRNWPVSYQDFTKFYDQAEHLFRVRKDYNFRHPGNELLNQHLKKAGLKPYPLPMANEDQSVCGNCQSMLCASGCKNDSGKICIEPAIKHHGARLLTDCEVKRIEISGRTATGVEIFYQGSLQLIKAQKAILSAGGLVSPTLLLNSKCAMFPNGLGNHSGLVGRYLMRHLVDLYALKIDSAPDNKHSKELGLNDFYEFDGKKVGTVQSFGRLPPVEVILIQLEMSLPSKLLRLFFKVVKPLLKTILNYKTKDRLVIASIIEDTPQYENRVWSDNDQTYISYTISDQDHDKLRKLRHRLKTLFQSLDLWFLPASEKNEMLAHVCGTCRMDENPTKGVVGTDNKVHGLENLYVVDASFFPTSGGTNPALTIAANSLRVAELLLKQEKAKVPATNTHH